MSAEQRKERMRSSLGYARDEGEAFAKKDLPALGAGKSSGGGEVVL